MRVNPDTVDLSFQSKEEGVQYALGSDFEVRDVRDGYEATATRDDMPEVSFTLTQLGRCFAWVRD